MAPPGSRVDRRDGRRASLVPARRRQAPRARAALVEFLEDRTLLSLSGQGVNGIAGPDSPVPIPIRAASTAAISAATEAGDFDLNGKTDLSVFRPGTAQWIIRNSNTGAALVTQFGDPVAGDVPVPGDYEGNNRTDLAVFRPSSDQWIIQLASGGVSIQQMGDVTQHDIPAPGDYEGIGKTDLAVFRPGTDQWIIRLSTGATRIVQFGDPAAGDVPAPGDYDGDGKTDLAVFRPSADLWIVAYSGGGSRVVQFGDVTHHDLPAPGDYNGDRKTDLAVFRPGTDQWIVAYSGGGSAVNQFGDTAAGDTSAGSRGFTLSATVPTFSAVSPASGLLTNQNVTVTGQAAASPWGLKGVAARTDSGAFVPLALDAAGHFRLSTALALGGTADGPHTVTLRATDNAGNVASAPVAFTLDTVPPVVPTLALAPADREAGAGALATVDGQVTLTGQTDPNVTLTLAGTGLTAQSSSTGTFQFVGVALAAGANTFTVTAADGAGNSSSSKATVRRDPAAGGTNPVIFWNQAALQAIENDASTPEFASRGLAMVSAAVYDAVNAIDGTPGYYVSLKAPAGASAEAAVASAAYTVLSYLYPAQQAGLDSVLATAEATIPAGQARTDGLAVGQSVADAIVAMRRNDGSTAYVDYTPGTAAGDWQPTAPAFAPAENPQWATLKPFAMTSPGQFRPAAPPALTSQAWADAVNMTLSIGSVNSTTRTAAQTQSALFWNDKAGTYTPPGHWNAIAEQAAQQQGNGLAQDARLFAELNVAEADAAVVAWDAKYTYNTWRPIQVAANVAASGNGQVVQPAAGWTPLLGTPPFPEYVSGHSTFSGAAAAVLSAAFGSSFTFTASSVGLPGVTRSYTSFAQAAQDAGESRIYGGIHFEFSNQAALNAGSSLAAYVLQTFATATDTTPPTITLTNPAAGSLTSSGNVTITGQVLDNLSGVKSLMAQVDGGAFAPVAFGATGAFSLTTTLPLGGPADGPHTINFQATDFAGNVTQPVPVALTLDTKAPALTLSSPLPGALTAGALLTGTADGTGSAVTALSYNFDGGSEMPVAMNPGGGFSQPLDLSRLAVGNHTLTVSTRDAAGNVSHAAVNLSLAALPALTLASVAPAAGATDVGLTYRPRVTFSRPIDTTTLNANDFNLTDPSGALIPTTIVPSNDGTYAWLFPTNPMPGASLVTLNVVGSSIKAADGSALDAAGSGAAGSALRVGFTTVNAAQVPNTTLSGILADPGPDQKPGTTDDVKPGPDGILMTGDDVYLHPIAGATVYILGHQDQAVTTGADGSFSFGTVPTGDVKLVIEGGTATNPPAGFYFPSMTLDLILQAGRANSVMGSMTTPSGAGVNPADKGVYLPRVSTSILQNVSTTQSTTITVPAVAGQGLTPDQQKLLTITVPPNSLVGANGQKMTTGQVGISTVPPSIVMDMLPPGVLQHSFDFTIQAPGVSTFATPVTLTFPNVFNSAPGTKVYTLSFDHTTGRLVIDGTATVSADGRTVTTDPGSGITAPGWHMDTPDGSVGSGPTVGYETGSGVGGDASGPGSEDPGATPPPADPRLTGERPDSPPPPDDGDPKFAPPTLYLSGPSEITEGQTLTLMSNATDPSGAPLTFFPTGSVAPLGHTDPQTGVFTLFIYGFMANGPLDISIGVSDGHHSTVATVRVQAIGLHKGPQLGPIQDQVVVFDATSPAHNVVEFTPSVTDNDISSVYASPPGTRLPQSALSYSISSSPGQLGTVTSDGLFTFLPEKPGKYQFTYVVTDHFDQPKSDSKTFTVTVENNCSSTEMAKTVADIASAAVGLISEFVRPLKAAKCVVSAIPAIIDYEQQVQALGKTSASASCVAVNALKASLDLVNNTVGSCIADLVDPANILQGIISKATAVVDQLDALNGFLKCVSQGYLTFPESVKNLKNYLDDAQAVLMNYRGLTNPAILVKQLIKEVSNYISKICPLGSSAATGGLNVAVAGMAQSTVFLGDDTLLLLKDLNSASDALIGLLNGVTTGLVDQTIREQSTVAADFNTLGSAADAIVTQANGGWTSDRPFYKLTDLDTGFVIRGRLTSSGKFDSLFLAPNSLYEMRYLDPVTMMTATSTFLSSPSGVPTTITPTLFRQPVLTDANGNGVPDDFEDILGYAATPSDLAALQQGLTPSSNSAFPTGVVSSLPLQGSAQSVTLAGSALDPKGQTAYLATGSYGLAVVNASNFQKPTVQSQLALAGNSTDVAVDPNLNVAVVASNAGGLNFVDVSNPAAPKLMVTVNANSGAVRVENGVAYAAVGTGAESFDVLTGELLQTLSFGGGNVTALTRDGSFLYALDAANTLRVVDVSGPLMVARGSVTLPAGGGRVFAANGVVSVAVTPFIPSGGRAFVSGYEDVDVSNPDSPKLLGALGTATNAGQAVALNGSGLALAVGLDGFAGPGAVDLFDASDPTKTSQFLTRFALPAAPLDVAIGAGIGFVADGTGGLQVVNYEPFDTKGVPPSATISLSPSANVTVTPTGLQASEGATVPITVKVSDDVQVRNVQLLVNGHAVANAVSAPFDLAAALPTIAQNGNNPVTIQVRATDTGGNSSVSNTLTLQLVPDRTPPVLLSSSLVNGSATRVLSFRSVTLQFSKPLDPSTVTASNFALTGPNGVINPTNIQFRRGNATVVLTYPLLTVGNYQFVIHAASVADTAGNPLGASDLVSNFSVVTASAVWANPAGGFWDVASNWLDNKVPGPTDDVLVALPAGASVIYRGSQPAVRTLTNQGTIWVQGDNARGDAQLNVTDLLLNSGTIRIESANSTWASRLSAPSAQILNTAFGLIAVNPGSGGSRSISGTLTNQGQVVVAAGTLLTISGVYEAAGGSITGPGYLVNAQLKVTASPASPSTILIGGTGDTLVTDNLPGYTLWVNGCNLVNSDAILNLGASVTNRGAILLQSSLSSWRSDVSTGTYTLTNAGTITASLGSGGERLINGTLANAGTVSADGNDYLLVSGTYRAQGGTMTGPAYLVNCAIAETASPASPSTILIGGTGDTLTTDNLPGYTLWVNGCNLVNSDAFLNLGASLSNRGAILLQSSNSSWRSDVFTGSHTLTNLGTITASLGSGGERLVSGTLNNQASVSADLADYLFVTGTYQAQGGTLTGPAYLVNCKLVEMASPASPSTILIGGTGDTLTTDNLPGYTLWVNGCNLVNSDAFLNLGASLSNRGAILLQSSNSSWRSDVTTGSHTLTNLGTITASLGSGGERLVSGTLNNQASVSADLADYLFVTGTYQAQGGTLTGPAYLVNCKLVEMASPASPSTILIGGTADTLTTDNLPGYTLWVNGCNLVNSDAFLNLGAGVTNRGAILLQSSNSSWRSDVFTGSYTLTNAGTITASLGSGGERLISGTLANAGTVSADSNDYLYVSGTYQAQGGALNGPAYLINCKLFETVSPASASTILIGGTGDTLSTDNLPGYTLWVNGCNLVNSDAILNLSSGVTNRGTILLQSSNSSWRSNLSSASGPAQNGATGVINVGLGSGGGRTISGDLINAGTLQFSGASPIGLNLTGNYTQNASGTLSVRLAGSGSYDALAVTGKATLDGTLAVSLLNGFVPKTGDVYKVVTHASRVGTFAQLTRPTGSTLRVVYNNTDTDLTP